ncbi:MAG TPA: response regulator [Chloroflexota bacterium]|nr:response regulator [Chloroflexota bacterium]
MPGCIILVVEDDPEIRTVLLEILEEENLTVIGARSGAEALAIVEQEAIDLIILDLVLPDVSGIAMIKEIRSRRSTTAILALSGSPAGLTMAQEQGVDGFLAKPFDLDDLVEVVTRLCPAKGKRRQPSRTTA